MPSLSLARQRLLLGVSAVGATVVLAATALLLDLPGRSLSNDSTAALLPSLATALAWPVLFALLLFPLDLLGGVVAVHERPRIGTWLAAWGRGVTVQLAVFAASGGSLIAATRLFGVVGAVVVASAGSVAILASLDRLARWGASMRRRTRPDSRHSLVVEVADPAFVGGFAGLLRPRLTVPAAWFTLADDVRDALLDRRRLAAGGHRLRGTVVALAWTAAGALVSAGLVGMPDSAAGLVRFSFGCTLWSFLGVLVLPTPSRRAVIALDRSSAVRAGPEAVARGIMTLDRWQDDEPRRAPIVEAVFHPVPSRDVRLAALVAPGVRAKGAWRAARLALPAGAASWSVLGRAVHCNIGRPALWWMLPGD